MNRTAFTFDSSSCRFFHVGPIGITEAARKSLTDEEICAALRRHIDCDFGEVSWEHHCGNLQLIAESRGMITSIYRTSTGTPFHIMTVLDDFEPRTTVSLQ